MTYLDLRNLLPRNSREVVIGLPGGDLAINAHTLAVRDLRENSSQVLELPTLTAQFLLYLEINEDRKPTTLRNYRLRLGQFLAWLDSTGQDPTQPAAWQAYFGTLKERQLSAYTRKGHYHILNRFGRWLAEQGHLRFHPFETVRPPSPPKNASLNKGISEEHIQAMLIAARKDRRDWALFLFFRDTGCRASEAISLRWRDLSLKRGEPGRALVTGKGDKTRYLFWGVETTRALLSYRRAVSHGANEPVWWGKMRYTEEEQAGPLTYDGLYKVFKRLARRAGLDDSVFSPHAWRHAFGRDLTIKGAPTSQLQDLMGHESIETTKIYSQFNFGQLAAAHAQYSPVDNDLARLRESGLLPAADEEEEGEGENGASPAGPGPDITP